MSDFKTWPEELMTEFIGLYQLLPCLFDKKSEHYYDRAEKAKAYNLLLQIVNKIDPNINKIQLMKLVNNMKALYRLELRRIAKKAAKGQKYKPKLAHFHLIAKMFDCVDKDIMIIDKQEIKQEVLDLEDIPPQASSPVVVVSDSSDNSFSETASPTQLDALETIKTENVMTPKVKNNYPTFNLRDLDKVQLRAGIATRPSFSTFGRYIGEELDNLPPKMAHHTQRIFYDALFEAKCGTLNHNSRIVHHAP